MFIFRCSADHEQDWQPHPVDPYSAIRDDHVEDFHVEGRRWIAGYESCSTLKMSYYRTLAIGLGIPPRRHFCFEACWITTVTSSISSTVLATMFKQDM